MPLRAAARKRSCGSGRMRPIVMPSSHHLQLILSVPDGAGPRRMRACAERQPGHLVWCLAKRQALSASSKASTTAGHPWEGALFVLACLS